MTPTSEVTSPAAPARPLVRDGRSLRVLYLVTEDWYFCSHRLPVARAARDAGAEVIVATRVGDDGDRIRSEGFRLVALPWRRRSRNPLAEARALAAIARLYRNARPDIVHHVALKSALYGGVAARVTRVPVQIHAITGFGFAAYSSRSRARLWRAVIRAAFARVLDRPGSHALVQNPDDAATLVRGRLFAASRVHVVRGSGVDTRRFAPSDEPPGPVTATLAGRMLWAKGVAEFVAAARILRARGLDVRMQLVGGPDPETPDTVPRRVLEGWSREGVVEWIPHARDMRAVWSETHVAVLPSYGEGLPMSLLEAGACARAMVASDVPGCREIVRHEETGLLVPVRDAAALADAVARLAGDAALRRTLGANARALVCDELSVGKVVDATLDLYRRLCGVESRDG